MFNLIDSAALLILILQAPNGATPSLSNADLEFAALERDARARASSFDNGASTVAIQSARREIIREYQKRRLSMSQARAARFALAVARKQPFVRSAQLSGGTIRFELTFGQATSGISLHRLDQRDPF